MSRDPLTSALESLFDAQRVVRQSHERLAEGNPGQVVPLLERAVGIALELEDESESSMRLVEIAAILAELEGPRAMDLLVRLLGCEDLEVRHAAGEALVSVAFDRFKEVALAVERALGRLRDGDPALAELPYVLARVPEPGVVKLLGRFLGHADADSVASAIEALVELNDSAHVGLLRPLSGDTRTVQLEDDAGASDAVTIGELAEEAQAILLGSRRGGPERNEPNRAAVEGIRGER